MSAGRFVVIEGIDGSGTSTQARRIAEALRATGRDVVLTHEPTEGAVGRLLRRYLAGEIAGPADQAARHRLFALLFAADRQDHLAGADGIEAALAAGRDVVCARYVLSSLAYEGGDDAEMAWVRALNRTYRFPDLTLYLDCPVEVALGRITATRDHLDVFENREMLAAVRLGYERAFGAFPAPVVKIDATRPEAEITAAVLAALA